MTEQEQSFEHIHKNVQSILFKFKDLKHNSARIEILTHRTNLTTKIYCRNKVTSENFTFLVSPSYNNKVLLLNIVAAVLISNNFDIESSEKYNNDFVSNLSCFLEENNNIKVCLESDIICLRTDDKFTELMNVQNTEKVAKQVLLRSLCILLAMVGKNVTNNMDNLALNDYGVTNLPATRGQ